jgi:hypothetical protein
LENGTDNNRLTDREEIDTLTDESEGDRLVLGSRASFNSSHFGIDPITAFPGTGSEVDAIAFVKAAFPTLSVIQRDPQFSSPEIDDLSLRCHRLEPLE